MFFIFSKKYIQELIIKNKGEKRKFIFYGFLNFFVTNIILQILLSLNILSTPISTFISQIVNMIIGYLVYKNFVFKIKTYKKFEYILKYSCLMTFLWITNTLFIMIGVKQGISKNIMALNLIPFLAASSYLFQKFWVFKLK